MEDELRGALAALLDGLPPRRVTAAVDRLMACYRGGAFHEPVLGDRGDVIAYAAYRMPATFAAASAAFGALARRTGTWSPGSHLDLGGGTGAAVWAAAATWGDGPRQTRVVDQAREALALGGELAARGTARAVRDTDWRRRSLLGAVARPWTAELVTACYVLGELTEEDRAAVVRGAAEAAGEAVVLIEPGTPDGFERIRAAREQLVAAGLRVLAPCPHSVACPIAPGADWCHFAARVSRSALHRRVKGGTLPYEDEKFSYVAAVRAGGTPAPARVVRRPRVRKGQVLLDLCTAEGVLDSTAVTKRQGADYRAARNIGWGDSWPPGPATGGPPPAV
ncbi:rRNA methyltransferase [Streptomyces sp. AJS327]|uniref:small ribosomal subunit Rsm22 family protein n=1 Tax=Streptomyces sp. AJS327 TaxID=2545265 RepID=UPI001834A04D|nr:small ribosomal subunit Rsm22 family protein [Streptomyces sp. AJS327]MBA0050087.1 rRNA methyltransferase [Streptomyces sp. AJS327]